LVPTVSLSRKQFRSLGNLKRIYFGLVNNKRELAKIFVFILQGLLGIAQKVTSSTCKKYYSFRILSEMRLHNLRKVAGMSKLKKKNVPTEAELEVLKVLWKRQPATVRQLHEELNKKQKSAYTTTLKMLQIMHEKGLVERDESNRAHIYKAIYTEEQTQSSILSNLINRAFDGSKFDLVVRALGETASAEEISEIRDLLDALEDNKK
jgi:predicted transcriptional regulator